jgi:hypothetical protein
MSSRNKFASGATLTLPSRAKLVQDFHIEVPYPDRRSPSNYYTSEQLLSHVSFVHFSLVSGKEKRVTG